MMNFNDLWFNHAILMAKKSKDPRTKVGAVIVNQESRQIISSGYNGPPRGWPDSDLNDSWWSQKENKKLLCEHAERNAIYNAARLGMKTENCDIYVTLAPCHDCARGIIQAGIKNTWVPEQFSRPISTFSINGGVNYNIVEDIDWVHNTILLDGVEVLLV
jgi:deoxycytidylate deaminase